MKTDKVGRKDFCISTVIFLVSVFFAQAESPQRVLLHGHVPAVVPSLRPLGRLDGSNVLNLSISLPLHNREALTNLLQQIYDPASPLYRHYLSSGEFNARFGPTEQDYQTVLAWANRGGFAVAARHDSRMLLEVSAPVPDIERALQVTMRTYALPRESRNFFAPDTEPSVDAGIPVLSIGGLDNFTRPHPKNLRRAPLKTPAKVSPKTIGSGPNGNLAGFDYRAAYAPGVTSTGTGQSIGLVEFDGYYATDITDYESLTGVPAVPLQIVKLNGFSGKPTTGPDSGNGEVALDIEMSISMAPGLSSVVLFEAGPEGNPITVLESMTSSTYSDIKQFSCSWDFGSVSQTSMDDYFMKFATAGQTFFDAAGDFGAYTNGIPIPQPDDDAYITLAGGTALGTAGPGGAWLSETVWNTQEGPGGYAGAGGVSTTYKIATTATWQEGVNMTTNHGSTVYRNLPDVAMVADNVFIYADDGEQESTGGTSCAAPLWAAFTALANQQAVAAGKPTVGFLNPALYNIGTNSGYKACFDDVTIGCNTNDNSTEYLAVPGYDLCTGWGSPSGESLIIALTQPDGFQITPGRGAVANGPVGGPFTVSAQTFSLANAGKTAFNWSLGATSNWLSLSSTSGTLASGGSDSVTLTVNSAANLLPAGLYTAGLWFTNQSSGLAQLRQFTLQVSQELVLDGGFEAGDFAYWTLSGDSAIYTNNFVDSSDDLEGLGLPSYAGNYFAALGQLYGLAYLSQPVPTLPGHAYLLSFELSNPAYDPPNQFQVLWNANSNSPNIIFNQTDMGAFGYSNAQFVVEALTNVTTLQFGNNNAGFFLLDNVSVMPVPAAVFQAPALVNGSLQLTWPSLPGVSYQVQYTASLAQPNWINLGAVITATGNSTTVTETIGPDPQGFYRVVLSP
jgi:subtilase family serine protease